MVQSPILARYAAAAYRLRQKPLGVCCLSCQQWVWESSVGPPSTGAFLRPVGLWPGAAEAATTGARFFPVDFGADEAAELCKAESKLAPQYLAQDPFIRATLSERAC